MENLNFNLAQKEGYELLCVLSCGNSDWDKKNHTNTPFVKGERYSIKTVTDFLDTRDSENPNILWNVNLDSDYFCKNYDEVKDLIKKGIPTEKFDNTIELMWWHEDDPDTYYSPVFFIYVEKENKLKEAIELAKGLNNEDLWVLSDKIKEEIKHRFVSL